jgi:CopG family nickel-responsive transcriptional regulator
MAQALRVKRATRPVLGLTGRRMRVTFVHMSHTRSGKGVRRFSISMPAELVAQLDGLMRARGHDNRSQAVAEMVRDHLVEQHGLEADREIAGTVTLVYDHHRRNIQPLLTDIQHDHGGLIIAALHVHLDHHNCMEVLAVRGQAASIRHLADRLVTARGVKHGKLTVTTTGTEFVK